MIFSRQNMRFKAVFLRVLSLLLLLVKHGATKLSKGGDDLTLAIDVNEFITHSGSIHSGEVLQIFAISHGVVMPFVLDQEIFKKLPIIPVEVNSVNFTHRAGRNRYSYEFSLKSYNKSIMLDPFIDPIQKKGRIPRKSERFSIFLPCRENQTGIAHFTIILKIEKIINKKERFPVKGTPFVLNLKKSCEFHEPDPLCNMNCGKGRCNAQKICQCPKGFTGKFCEHALCFPLCANGGTCIKPGHCSCAPGYHGQYCEGGICLANKCLNGGKCFGKDKCHCPKAYFGERCSFSLCKSPCINGRCVGIGRCRCKPGYMGSTCSEKIVKTEDIPKKTECPKKCINGTCHLENQKCVCEKGWFGARCNRRKPKRRREKKLEE